MGKKHKNSVKTVRIDEGQLDLILEELKGLKNPSVEISTPVFHTVEERQAAARIGKPNPAHTVISAESKKEAKALASVPRAVKIPNVIRNMTEPVAYKVSLDSGPTNVKYDYHLYYALLREGVAVQEFGQDDDHYMTLPRKFFVEASSWQTWEGIKKLSSQGLQLSWVSLYA